MENITILLLETKDVDSDILKIKIGFIPSLFKNKKNSKSIDNFLKIKTGQTDYKYLLHVFKLQSD